ncbi:MAG: ribonucleotide reductase N-terminal alpha domain-containing protein [Bacillota bacterium]|nr:ribonucleotide reductase N-terminal alpha domain-containing protein [Bacillota bacterium]
MRELSEAGRKVFEARYAAKDERGRVVETFEQAVERIAVAAAGAEKGRQKKTWASRFAAAIGDLTFVPSTPIWANMGKTDRPWQPSACFVLALEDSLESMYQTLKETALVFKSGGGVGYNFSPIRPRGAMVSSTKGHASGVVELIRLYDASSGMVMQGGVRRGASMGILNADHPEIIDFINSKRSGAITHFNLSVGITDAFMEARAKDADWPLVFDGKTYDVVKARDLWHLITEAAHACGDPGLVFLDRLQRDNPVPSKPINATNPCFHPDTLIVTEKGLERIEDLYARAQHEEIIVLTDDRVEDPNRTGLTPRRASVVKTGRKKTIHVVLANGQGIKVTPDHRLFTARGWVEAQHLISGDRVFVRPKLSEELRNSSCSIDLVSPVERLESSEEVDVYDIVEPVTHSLIANGIVAHNCGEQPLSPGESCLLGSISLEKMLRPAGDGYEIDWDRLAETTCTGVRFLDDIIDVAAYPLDYIAEATRATRKIGLGVTGLHDMLIMLGLPYDSEEGRHRAADVLRFIQKTAHAYSEELAAARGPFPDWEKSVFYLHTKRRNAACITIAPTGSVTTMAGCEGYGIEPIFAVAYSKATDVAGTFEVFSPLFRAACERHGVPREVMSEVARRGSCQGVEGVPEDLQAIFKGAQDIAPEDHVRMQIELQKHVDNAISKTVNLPNSATIYDVERIYETAYEGGLKGITIFRDGCKEGVVTVGKKEATPRAPGEFARGEIRPRPANAQGVTHRLDSGCGKIYLTVNYLPENGEIIETFITTGSDGGCLIYTEATSRLISLAIRGGISIEEIVEQLNSTHACPSYQFARGRGKPVSPGKSCASAIARKLTEIKEQLASRHREGRLSEQLESQPEDKERPDHCPVCGEVMRRAEGCFVCQNCGYGKC